MFSQPIRKDYVSRQLDRLSPEKLAEVAHFIEFLQFNPPSLVKEGASRKNIAFGMWKDYSEANEPAAFALKLRRQIETRQDVFINTPN